MVRALQLRRSLMRWLLYRPVIVAGTVFALLAAGATPMAHADEASARCQRVRAEADSAAYLLYAPSVSAQLVHLPPLGDVAPTDPVGGEGYQARALLSLSAVDIVRGRLVQRAARAECHSVTAAARLRQIVGQGPSYGAAAALRAQLAVLDGSAERVEAILDRAELRRQRQVGTVLQLDELRLRALRLRRMAAQTRQELELLRAHDSGDDDVPPLPLLAELGRYEGATMSRERELSRLRRLDAVHVDLQLGAVPSDGLAWYGMLSVSFDLGGLAQGRAERRYLAARAAELAGDEEELRAGVEHFARAMADSARELEAELDLIDRQLALMEEEKTKLRRLATDNAEHLLALGELDELELRARRAYLKRLAASRRAVAGTDHDTADPSPTPTPNP